MDASFEIEIRVRPGLEDIIDQEIIRGIVERHESVEQVAARIKRDPATLLRRLGNVMARLLGQVQ